MRNTMCVVTLAVLIPTALVIGQEPETEPLFIKADGLDELLRTFADAAATFDIQKCEQLFLPPDETLAGKNRAAIIREMRKDWKRGRDSGAKGIPVRFEQTKKVVWSRMIVSDSQEKEETSDVVFTVAFTDQGWKIVSMETQRSSASKSTTRTSIQGLVTVDGQPLESGTIIFKPVDGPGPVAGSRIKNGAYSIPSERGPKPGEYRVEISSMRKTGKKVMDRVSNQQLDEVISIIPPRYNSKSLLRCTLTNSRNTLDFDLKLK